MHGELESDTSAAQKAAGFGAEVEDTKSQEDNSNVINGLVLFEPGPPPPGLNHDHLSRCQAVRAEHGAASAVQHRENLNGGRRRSGFSR
jgi:hypothetical protein